MHALIVVTHPAACSLTRSVAATLVEAIEANGHTTEIADLSAERFDPVFGTADHAAFSAGALRLMMYGKSSDGSIAPIN